jgi:hypothetical protein
MLPSGDIAMRPVYPSLILLAALIAAAPATAQSQLPRPNQLPPPGGAPMQPPQMRPPGPPQAQPAPAPAKPYRPLAFTMPAPVNDPSFEAFRKQLGDVANRKDRPALTRLVVAQGFFWDTESGDKADKRKSGLDNLAAALGGFGGPNASGWEALAAAAQDPTLEPSEDHKGAMCGPAGPTIDDKAFEALTKETGTDAGDWAFPTTPTLVVRAGAQPNAPIVERLGMHLIRVLPDTTPQGNAQQQNAPQFLRVVTPSGKTGYVSEDTVSPIGFDQICYAKDASGWKIAGYSGSQ